MRKSPRPSSNRPVTTRSGKVLKVHRSFGERYNAMRQAKSLRKVNRLRGLPKSRIKRTLWRLHPKRLAEFWFSRDGAIMALKFVGVGLFVLFVLTLAVFAYFRKDLHSITDVSGSNLGGSISYYDRTGQTLLWQDYNAVKRVPVQSNDISPYMKEAIVSIEDKDFYKHRGFDIKGIVRAAVVDVLHRGGTQGGSTITEQLVKLTRDYNQTRTVSIKVKELILAVELERTYTKDQILTSYLNVVPFGSVDYGVQAAASDYFHENAKDLTLAQSAFLASIPKYPSLYSKYSPYFDQKAFLDRDYYVLDQMAAQGKITKAQAAAAKKVDVIAQVQPQQAKYAGIKAPYFVLAARDEVNTRFSTQSAKIGGWKVITTLDMTLQTKAEQLVQSNIANISRYGADEEALVLEDVKTGQMEALVGGTDFNNADHGYLNYAHSVRISPGSSFKPYDYGTLIDNNTNVGAGSVLYDSQSPLPGYSCTNHSLPPPRGNGNCLEDYDFRYPGALTLRYAIGGSRNVPAVKAMLESTPNDTSDQRTKSINKVISTADAMMDAPSAYQCYKDGVDVSQATATDETQCYGSSAMGDGAYLHLDQHINGIATFGRLGNAIPNTYILRINDSTNKPVYQFKQPKGTQVIRPDSAYIVDSMTSDPNASYLPAGYYKWHHYDGWVNSIKTGTTGSGFDGLMMGWNPEFAVGSWVGYHTRNRALTTSMEYLTTPLTRGLMTFAEDNSHMTPVTWTEPSDIQHLPAFVVHNKVSANGEVVPSPATDIYPSWYKQKSTSSSNATIDKVSGKLATSCTPALAKQSLSGNAAPNAYSIDVFYPPGASSSASNTNTSANDDVHNCSDNPPSIASFFIEGQDASGGGTVDCSGSCTITTTVTAGTHPFTDAQYAQYPGTVSLLVNGSAVQSQQVSDSPSTISFTYTGSGSVTVAVQVTDSVLYSATSGNATVTFESAPSGPSGFSATRIGPSVSFSWSGGSGPYTVYRVTGSSGTPVGSACNSTSGTICSATGQPAGSSFYVQDNNGNKSSNSSA